MKATPSYNILVFRTSTTELVENLMHTDEAYTNKIFALFPSTSIYLTQTPLRVNLLVLHMPYILMEFLHKHTATVLNLQAV
jgi:hypothetical protein